MKKTMTEKRVEILKPHAKKINEIAVKSIWGRLSVGPRGGRRYVNFVSGCRRLIVTCNLAGADRVFGIDYWSGSNPTPSTAMSKDVYNYIVPILQQDGLYK